MPREVLNRNCNLICIKCDGKNKIFASKTQAELISSIHFYRYAAHRDVLDSIVWNQITLSHLAIFFLFSSHSPAYTWMRSFVSISIWCGNRSISFAVIFIFSRSFSAFINITIITYDYESIHIRCSFAIVRYLSKRFNVIMYQFVAISVDYHVLYSKWIYDIHGGWWNFRFCFWLVQFQHLLLMPRFFIHCSCVVLDFLCHSTMILERWIALFWLTGFKLKKIMCSKNGRELPTNCFQ